MTIDIDKTTEEWGEFLEYLKEERKKAYEWADKIYPIKSICEDDTKKKWWNKIFPDPPWIITSKLLIHEMEMESRRYFLEASQIKPTIENFLTWRLNKGRKNDVQTDTGKGKEKEVTTIS